MPDSVTLRDSEGRAYGVPQDQVASYLAQGFTPESVDQHDERLGSEVQHELYGGPLGTLGAIGTGALSGLTLGGSDLAIEAMGGGGTLRGLEAEHPYAAGAGNLAGAVLPTVLTGGAAAGEEAAGIGARILAHSPAGLVSRAGGAITGLGEGAGLLGRVAAGTAGAAAEGALYGGGQYLTETALEDKPLSAEGFVAGMGHGALFTAPIGGAATLASGVLQRARALFPRSEVSAAAAAGVKEQATGAIAQAVRDGDQMAAAAERKLSDVEAKDQMAQAGETVTRRVFGGADPQAIGDQVTGAIDRQQITQALQGYQQARQQFDDWLASEADPELARSLAGLQAPGIGDASDVASQFNADAAQQYAARAGQPVDPRLEDAMKELVGRGDAVGAGGVPVGEFGAPGARGIKTPEELQRIAEGSASDGAAPALEQPATRALRGAQGTPVEPPAAPHGDVTDPLAVHGGTAEFDDRGQRVVLDLKTPSGAGNLTVKKDGDGYRVLTIALPKKLRGQGLGSAMYQRMADYVGTKYGAVLRSDAGAAISDDAAKAWGRLEAKGLARRVYEGGDTSAERPSYWEMDRRPKVPAQEIVQRGMADEGAAAARQEAGTAVGKRPAALRPDLAPGRIEVKDIGGQHMRATMPDGTTRDIAPGGSDKFLEEQMPPGFRPAKIQTHLDFAVEHELPRTAADANENAIVIARPSELAKRDLWGNELKEANRDSILEAWKEGKDVPPIDAFVMPDGRIYIEDGNHRIQAAAQTDRPVALRFKSGENYDPQRGAREIGDRVRSDLPHAGREAPTPPATDTLTGQLRGTAAKLGAGEDLAAMGEPARAEYRTAKAKKTAEAAEHFRAKTLASREERTATLDAKDLPLRFDPESRTYHPAEPPLKSGASSEAPWNEGFGGHTTPENSRMAIEERAAQAEHKAGIVGRRAGIGGGLRYSVQRAEPEVGDATMGRILAKHGLNAPAAAEPDSLAARIMRNADAAGNPTIEEAIARNPKVEIPPEPQHEMPPPMTKQEIAEQRQRFRAIAPEQRAAKAIMRHNGKNVDIGPSLGRAAKAIGDMEEASAKLTDVLGADAPPTAVQNAQAYRAATGKVQDQAAASSAKAAADIKTKVQPGMDATVVDDEVTKALRQHEGRAARGAKGAAAGEPLGVAETAPGTGGIGSKLADAGGALEVLRAIGAHVPAVSHIPIIGPVLGLWLKARAVMGILGRKGGSIGKSTEGVIAAKAAATRDRITAATGAILQGAAKATGKAAHLAGPAALLAGQLFPGGENPASDKPRDLYQARMDEIVRAQSPGAVDQAIAQRYPTSDPALHDAVVAQVQRGIAFLATKAPKQTVLPGVLPGDGTWKPSAAAIEEFGKYVHAVNDPVSVLEDLAKGHVYAEGAETLKTVYPQLYQVAQKELLQAAPEMAKTLPYPRRVMISILYGIPVDGTLAPTHALFLQTPAPPTPAMKGPTFSGPLRLGQQTMSPLDQRAAGA